MPSHITLLSLFAAFVAVTTSQSCYGLDGTQLDDTYAPCKPTAKHSGCCATKRAIGADICLDSGLCMSTRAEFMGMIWQNGCTDATGKDVACPKICPDATTSFGGLDPVPAWNVQQCDYGTYCCRAPDDRQSCCDDPTAPQVTTSSIGAFMQFHTATTITPSATSVPTQVVASAVSTGPAFAATAAPASDLCKKERHQTAVVGGTIGGLFGAIIVSLLGALFWIYKQEKRQRKLKEHYEEQFVQTTNYRQKIASSAVSIMGGEGDAKASIA